MSTFKSLQVGDGLAGTQVDADTLRIDLIPGTGGAGATNWTSPYAIDQVVTPDNTFTDWVWDDGYNPYGWTFDGVGTLTPPVTGLYAGTMDVAFTEWTDGATTTSDGTVIPVQLSVATPSSRTTIYYTVDGNNGFTIKPQISVPWIAIHDPDNWGTGFFLYSGVEILATGLPADSWKVTSFMQAYRVGDAPPPPA